MKRCVCLRSSILQLNYHFEVNLWANSIKKQSSSLPHSVSCLFRMQKLSRLDVRGRCGARESFRLIIHGEMSRSDKGLISFFTPFFSGVKLKSKLNWLHSRHAHHLATQRENFYFPAEKCLHVKIEFFLLKSIVRSLLDRTFLLTACHCVRRLSRR